MILPPFNNLLRGDKILSIKCSNNFFSNKEEAMRRLLFLTVISLGFLLTFLAFHFILLAQDFSDSEQQDKEIVDRFWNILLQSPRYGIAFDRVYSYYVDQGTVNELAEQVRKQTVSEPKNGKSFLLLGLILLRQNNVEEAETVFRRAEDLMTDDPFPSAFLAEMLIVQGRLQEAADALERSLQRKPIQSDMIKNSEKLGGIYERLGNSLKAGEVWTRLEATFPNNIDVLTRIAETLEREGKFEEALKQYQKLSELTKKNNTLRHRFTLAAADIKIRLGNKQEALDDFELLLDSLIGTSWQADSIRSRIERLFIRQNDYVGLAGYYEKRLVKHPNEIETICRLAVVLNRLSRNSEAQNLLKEGIFKSPSNIPLRLTLIDLYKNQKNNTEIDKLFAEINALEPNNPDYLSQWGLTVLGDSQTEETVRKQRTVEIWNKIVETHPNDVASVTLTAGLFASHGFSEQAESLYQKAIELRPENPDLYENLGNFYHRENKQEKAVATFWKTVEGSGKNAATLIRLGDTFQSLGLLDDAIKAFQEAVTLEPNRLELRLRFADLLFDNQFFDRMAEQLTAAKKLAESDEDWNLLVQLEARQLQAVHQLETAIDQLKTLVFQEDPTNLKSLQDLAKLDWKLANYQLLLGETEQAAQSVERGLQRDDQSKLLLRTAAEVITKTQDYRRAITILEKLIKLDIPHRTEYLRQLATLQKELGNVDQAIETARQMIVLGSGNASNLRFLAEILLSQGQYSEGIEVLRRATRTNPNDTNTLGTLADVLFEAARPDEAIEIAWRIFELAGNLESKLSAVDKLSDFYQKTQGLEPLILRLQALGDETKERQNSAFCLARLYTGISNFSAARQSLESLLIDEPLGDAVLLENLSIVTEKQGDLENAIRYQEMLCEQRDRLMDQGRLLTLYLENKEHEKAAELQKKIETALKLQNQIVSKNTDSKLENVIETLNNGEWNNPNLQTGQRFERFVESFRNAEKIVFRQTKDEKILEEFDQTFSLFLQTVLNDSLGSAAPELKQKINRSVERWNQSLNKVQYGKQTLRTAMTIRNEKSIELLGGQVVKEKNPGITREILDICNGFEKNIFQIIELQWNFEKEWVKTFGETKRENVSHRNTSGFSITDLKRLLARSLESDAPPNTININPNIISYILGRAMFSKPAGTNRTTSHAPLEMICGTFSAMDNFMKEEKPVAGIDPEEIRTDRITRLLRYFDERYDSLPSTIRNNIDLVKEVFAVLNQNGSSNGGSGDDGSDNAKLPELLKIQAKKLLSQAVEADSLKNTEQIPVLSALVMISFGEDNPDTAFEYLEQIPCKTASEIKARELLLLELAQKISTEPFEKRRELAIDRLLGYQLSEEELAEFWQILQKSGRNEESHIIRRRLSAVSNQLPNLSRLLDDFRKSGMEDNNEDVSKAKEQSVILALKILRLPNYRVTSSSEKELAIHARQNAIDVLTWAGKLNEVIEQFESRVKSVPGSFEFTKQLAEIYFLMNRKTEAVKLLKQSEEKFKNIPNDAAIIAGYTDLLRRLEMNEAAEYWTIKEMILNPVLFIRNYSNYEKKISPQQTLNILGEINIQTVKENSYYIFRILQSIKVNENNKEQAERLLEFFWKADALSDADRAVLRQSAIRALLNREESAANDPIIYTFLKGWIFETISPVKDLPQNIHQVWNWSNHSPKTISTTFINISKELGKLNEDLLETRKVILQYESAGENRNWNRYASAKILEAAILFELENIEEALSVVRLLESRREYEVTLTENALVLGLKADNRPKTVDTAIKYYETAFRNNPHRAYEPFFSSRLYSLYLRSTNQSVREKGFRVALEKFRHSLELMKKCGNGTITDTGDSRVTMDTLSMFVERLGTVLIETGYGDDVRRTITELVKGQTWFEMLKNDPKRKHFAEIIEAVNAKMDNPK
jgi:tetratricopeptide (TPR) repeat protein